MTAVTTIDTLIDNLRDRSINHALKKLKPDTHPTNS